MIALRKIFESKFGRSILILVGTIIYTNLPPISAVIKFMADQNVYKYCNAGGSFTFAEYTFKQRDFAMLKRRHTSFLRVTNNSDTALYRIFNKNPLCIWRYKDYFFDRRYKLPYRRWNGILKRRGSIEYANNHQDF